MFACAQAHNDADPYIESMYIGPVDAEVDDTLRYSLLNIWIDIGTKAQSARGRVHFICHTARVPMS